MTRGWLSPLAILFLYENQTMTTSATNTKPRIEYIDWLRVIACLMVMTVHSSECVYSNDYSFSFPSELGRWSACLINGLMRPSVPLFLIASAYLLVPLKTDTFTFFRKRFTRVVIPFVIWLGLYSVLPALWGDLTLAEAGANLRQTYINFIPAASHLWFVYMLLGIYLIIPVISPWLEKISRREEEVYLGIWLFTTLFWHLHESFGDVFGECWWNPFPVFYYVSGYVGYVILAHYIKKYIHWSTRKSLIIGGAALLAGYAYCVYSFYTRSFTVEAVSSLEMSWQTTSIAPVIMSFGAFMMIRCIRCPKLYPAVRTISSATYGMYLMHMLILPKIFHLFEPHMITPVLIFATSITTYLICFAITYPISKLPFGKYFVG